MKVAIGSDHRGYFLKEQIKSAFSPDNIKFNDLGAKSRESCDFPDYAYPVAQAVANGQADKGILICSTGNGMAMAANKVKGVRAALALTPDMARLSRQHNNANVLVLPADFVDLQIVPKIVKVWLETEFEGGRHQKRLDKIAKYEEDNSK
ncbi:MAG: ribose 5-phosphate isomerase B [Candidatus Edwardsbacteria bacterium]|nr:ribose 5-phosphate isomerase B [Candidatus Edwardsbacteria bacterium]MBU1576927.1 ribose 5-phosphate isomerase B [Candidatus Edwardsbacteria bacterium]MBU2463075.1 ribose 5-phosphate isomerase B [Candidatus Edwardsbacteria bacterium]MBU2594289.1 ribose 5-phosphate isomerase B [Candidatus Edwardsbacteria bacterium]